MKKTTKMAMLTVGMALAASGVYAVPGDVILGINNNGSGTNDYVVDLGQLTTLQANGPTYDLSSVFGSTTVAQLQTIFSSTGAGIAGWNFGAVGGRVGGLNNLNHSVFTTTLRTGVGTDYSIAGTEAALGSINIGTLNQAAAIAASLNQFGTVLSTDPASYSTLVAQNPTTAGTAQNSFASYLSGGNPLSAIGAGNVATLDLWRDTSLNTSGSSLSGWTYVGALTLDLSGANPLLTYSVPEPTTFSLLGGAGLLLLCSRNKFRRNKQA